MAVPESVPSFRLVPRQGDVVGGFLGSHIQVCDDLIK